MVNDDTVQHSNTLLSTKDDLFLTDQPDIFLFLRLSAEKAAWHTCQVPHPVPLLRGGLVLYQHRVSSQLPSVARGKEQDDYRCVKTSSIVSLWLNFGLLFLIIFFNGFSETFSAPVFTSGRDKSGFSLGWSRNVSEVFGDRAKYWMVPVYSRWANCERAADLYHISRNIAEKYWLLLRLCSCLSLPVNDTIWQKPVCKSSMRSSRAHPLLANCDQSQIKLRLDSSSLQSGRWTFLRHQTGARRSWASKQYPPAKR